MLLVLWRGIGHILNNYIGKLMQRQFNKPIVIVTKYSKHPKCPPIGDSLNKLWNIHEMQLRENESRKIKWDISVYTKVNDIYHVRLSEKVRLRQVYVMFHH